jgi:hypothetical protein
MPVTLFSSLTDAEITRILYADGYGGNPLIEDLCRRLEEALESEELVDLQTAVQDLEVDSQELVMEVERLCKEMDLLENRLSRERLSHAKEVADLKEAIRDVAAGVPTQIY